MRKATVDFISRLKLVDLPFSVEKLILFGSESRGHARVISDIDIAVVSKNELAREIRHCVEDLIESCNPPHECQITFVVQGEYRDGFDVRRDIFEKGLEI